MCHWKNIGPEWKTRPAEDKRWTVMVREKDWEKAVRMLIRENLIRGAELEICAVEMVPEPERTVLSGVPVPSR